MRVGLETLLLELVKAFPLGRPFPVVDVDVVDERIEPAAADFFGVEQADGPGGGVAGVGERRLALVLLLPVDLTE